MSNYGYGMTPEQEQAYNARKRKQRNFYIGAGISGFILLVILIGIAMSIEVVKPGYAGVVYNKQGGIEEKTLGQGWHVVSPMKDITSYPVSTETMFLSADKKEGSKDDDSYTMNSKEGRPVRVSAEFTYRYDATTLPQAFVKFRGKSAALIEESFIRARIKEASNAVASKYEILDIYGDKRQVIADEIKKYLETELKESFIMAENFTFTEITPDEQTLKAIQERVGAQQALAKIETEKKISEQNAAKAKIEAEGAAQAAIIKAQSEAEVKRLAAEGEAKANKLLQESLNEKLVEYKQLEVQKAQADSFGKWPVQTFINGGSSTPLLNIPAPTAPVTEKK